MLRSPDSCKMNAFRLMGDMSHLLAIVILFGNIIRTKSCEGLSGKTQILFGLVYITRYLDLFTNFISIYNSVLKVVYIASTWLTVILIYWNYRKTYDREHDSFRAEALVLAAAALAFVWNHEFSALEVLWTFSIYLESVAIAPQLYMIHKTGEAKTITMHYLFAMGLYRALYIVNWVWRYYYEGFFDMIAIVAGCVQTVLYIDFFYVYCARSPIIEVTGDEKLLAVDI